MLTLQQVCCAVGGGFEVTVEGLVRACWEELRVSTLPVYWKVTNLTLIQTQQASVMFLRNRRLVSSWCQTDTTLLNLLFGLTKSFSAGFGIIAFLS